MRRLPIGILLAAALCLAGLPTATAQQSAGFEEDLALLARSMARLADTLERQERARDSEGGVERLRVLVSLLDIRAKKYEAMQRELQQQEDWGQRTLESIASNRSRLERLEESLDDPDGEIPEGTREELRQQRHELEIRIESSETRLQYYSTRQIDIQNRLLEQERLVNELDDLIQEWLDKTELKSSKR